MKTKATDQSNRGTDAIAFLEAIILDTPETRLVGKQESARLQLTDLLHEVRRRAGLTQAELAERLGVGQSWVSKLENVNYDHTLESVVKHLSGLDADLVLAVRSGENLVVKSPPDSVLVELPTWYLTEAEQAGMSLRQYVCARLETYGTGLDGRLLDYELDASDYLVGA